MPRAERPVERWTGLPSGECRSMFFRHGRDGKVIGDPVPAAVGVFQDEPSLGAAVYEPPISSFDSSDSSVLAGRRAVGGLSSACVS